MNSDDLRSLPVGVLVCDVDGDVWRVQYATIEGFEQAVLCLVKPRVDAPVVRTLDRVDIFGPFTRIRSTSDSFCEDDEDSEPAFDTFELGS